MSEMILKTSTNGDIAGGVVHYVISYSGKVPRFLSSSKVTLGNTIAKWRYGSEVWTIELVVTTESLEFYEAIIKYHNDGIQFRLNNTPDLGNLLLESLPEECDFGRLKEVKLAAGTVVYYMDMKCESITEGL